MDEGGRPYNKLADEGVTKLNCDRAPTRWNRWTREAAGALGLAD